MNTKAVGSQRGALGKCDGIANAKTRGKQPTLLCFYKKRYT